MISKRIGFIGLGNMGHPMAKNIEKAGFSLAVYNRTIEKAKDFQALSKVCESLFELVDNSDIIFTMLTNDAAVKEVYDQLIQLEIEDKLFVDMSTISQSASLEISDALQLKGASLMDAPVAGSTKPAADGTLIFMVGGAEKDVEIVQPILSKMGKLTKYLGENGKGLAAKISINYFLSILYQGLAETILLSDSLTIERADMLEIINESASGSGATKVKTPLLLNDDFKQRFGLDLMLKDINLAIAAGANFPLGNASQHSYSEANLRGFGSGDVIGIINYLKIL